jgi:two-component system, sensor histidine kinase and response regulator
MTTPGPPKPPLDRPAMLEVLRHVRLDVDRVIDSMLAGDAVRVSWTRILAHNVNNLLVTVFFVLDRFTDSLRQSAPASTSQHYANALRDVTERIQDTMRRLIAVGQLDDVVRLEPVDLRKATADAIQRLLGYATWKNIRVEYEPGGDEPLPVSGDRLGLPEILLNLVGNAIKYSPAGSTVTVRLVATADSAECRVTDQGPGIAPEDQPRLFQVGGVLGSRPTAGEPQTGIGLAISRHFADAMRGQLWCESEPGRGATFVFCLPRLTEPGEERR